MPENYQKYFESVKERYDMEPYPYRDPAKETGAVFVTATEYLGKINHYCFNGEKELRNNCRYLVAGGGTGDAVIYLAEQLRNSDCEIVYVDISTAAMDVAKARAKVRGLTNINWHLGSIMELPGMGLGEFDYINCSGVLHHLEDPLEALKALNQCLKADGCMGLLVYAKYGRASLYHLQALMQLVNADVTDTQEQITRAKLTMVALKTDPAQWLLRDDDRWAMELTAMGVEDNTDTSIYHLFLHEDHSFSVPELYRFVEGAGLNLTKLTGFPGHTRKYEPDFSINNNVDFNQLTNDLPERDRLAAGELINGGIISHTLYVSKTDNTQADIQDLDNVPYVQYKFAAPAQIYGGFHNNPNIPSMNIKMSENPSDMLVIHNNTYTKYLVKHLDGTNSLAEILANAKSDIVQAGAELDEAKLLNDYLALYNDFDKWDMILVRSKNIPHYNRVHEL